MNNNSFTLLVMRFTSKRVLGELTFSLVDLGVLYVSRPKQSQKAVFNIVNSLYRVLIRLR